MRFAVALLLVLAAPVAVLAAEKGYSVTYDGGSLAHEKSGARLKMYVEGATVRFVEGKAEVVTIPGSAITEVSYGENVHRRIKATVASLGIGALAPFGKAKTHIVGLTWAAGDHTAGLAMQCDKDEWAAILVRLQSISGRRAVNADEVAAGN